ncbi:Fibrinogen silencer-binding protein [Struthio camelus australis]|uniref:Fibrinogen silencer-binding protein n=1 Tax=Struthio camelus australis TaxID=441894 RepID=A0A093HJM5_STRCA|nr:PREDICTED: fibrinogen silencer-binding protein [Struthio camelus australis]KFV81906.1 Fibrinogen silencer-binding protein [Struthio camelus australis]
MVGKARSSNFTLSEKLDLLKLVKPYVQILEEHTNKHSVIVEKNKCWDIIADNYNAIGVDRPPRTAQGLRTLYKRLKEYAKQELLQQKETYSDYKSSISEPTKKVVEMIPQISNVCLRERSISQSAVISKETIAGTSSPQAVLDHHPATVMMELQLEEDVKPPPSLVIDSQQSENLGQEEEHQLVHVMERSPSTSVSSVDMRVMMSPSPIPRRDELFRLEVGERFRPMCGYDPQMLQMLKEEHQIILENQRRIGLYVQEKRDGLKRKQQLEEELLRAKIKVEKLKAIQLRCGLPEYSNI